MSRRRGNSKTRERGTAPGSKLQDEPGGKDGSCRSEGQRGELARIESRTLNLEPILQQREAALRQMQAEAREKQDRAASRDKKVQGGVPETPLQAEKPQRKADWDGRRRERRRMKGRSYSWQQEQGKERHRLTEREKPRKQNIT